MYTVIGKLASMTPACQFVADAALSAKIAPDLIGAYVSCAPDGVIVHLDGADTFLVTDGGRLVDAPIGAQVRTTPLGRNEYPSTDELAAEIATVMKIARGGGKITL